MFCASRCGPKTSQTGAGEERYGESGFFSDPEREEETAKDRGRGDHRSSVAALRSVTQPIAQSGLLSRMG